METGEEKTCLQDSLVMFCDMSEYVCVGGGGGVEREKGKTFGTFTKCEVGLRSFLKHVHDFSQRIPFSINTNQRERL